MSDVPVPDPLLPVTDEFNVSMSDSDEGVPEFSVTVSDEFPAIAPAIPAPAADESVAVHAPAAPAAVPSDESVAVAVHAPVAPAPVAIISDESVVVAPAAASVDLQAEALFCQGFQPQLLGSIFDSFPFQLLKDMDVVFSDESFHAKSCKQNNYFLLDRTQESNSVNSCCSSLSDHPTMMKIVEDANNTQKYLSTAHDERMSMHQLKQRLDNQRTRLNNMKLKTLNTNKKLSRVNKALGLHQRFVQIIKENSIPKLHELVKVASNRSRGIEYVIQRMVDTISGTYNARSSEDDVDVAFSNNQHSFINNISEVEDAPSHSYMLKVDETYAESKVRWNPRDNKLYGLCYEHARSKDLEFKSYEHVEKLSKLVKENILHTPKESMVIVVSSNSPGCKVQVVAALPTCSKSETEYQVDLINEISAGFRKKFGVPLLNWSTDGDSVRRKIFDFLMSYDLKEDSPIYEIMSKLKLVDLKVGRNEETTNFDAKHLAKRFRTFIVGGNFKVGNTIVSKTDVKKILETVPNDTNVSNDSLLNPRDKQNVPLAVQLLRHFSKAVEDVDKLKAINFKIEGIAEELHLMKYVIDGVLCTFVDTTITIKEQLTKISFAAHVLMILQRELHNIGTGTSTGSFIPNQLYHDLQASFEDAFFCAAKWKIYHTSLPLFLMLCSNDVLERFFGILRLKYRQCMIDNLEIIFATRAIELCGDMMFKHPEWFEKNRNVMQRISLDYSNPRDWDNEKLILQNVDIAGAFAVGRANAVTALNSYKRYEGDTSDFGSLDECGYTFLIPYGTRKIGFNPADPEEIDLSMDTVNEEGREEEEEEGGGDGGVVEIDGDEHED